MIVVDLLVEPCVEIVACLLLRPLRLLIRSYLEK